MPVQSFFYAMISGLRGYVTTRRDTFKYEYAFKALPGPGCGDRQREPATAGGDDAQGR